MTFIWATRGRSWGFKFLRDGGFTDPLPDYERAFAGLGDDAEAWQRVGDVVALRFSDPAGRTDLAGRVIPHEFVLTGDAVEHVTSVEVGRDLVWPQVADEFEASWDQPGPPARR